MNDDIKHLRLLSIFHYVVAGLVALFACIPIIHLIVGILIVFAPDKIESNNAGGPPEFIGWLFMVFSGFMILSGLIMAVLIAVTGRFLTRHKRRIFCIVIAAIECLFMPFGTVLGVFTIIVLSRDSVKKLFAENTVRQPENNW